MIWFEPFVAGGCEGVWAWRSASSGGFAWTQGEAEVELRKAA